MRSMNSFLSILKGPPTPTLSDLAEITRVFDNRYHSLIIKESPGAYRVNQMIREKMYHAQNS